MAVRPRCRLVADPARGVGGAGVDDGGDRGEHPYRRLPGGWCRCRCRRRCGWTRRWRRCCGMPFDPPTARSRCCTRWRGALGRCVRCLHRQRDLGRGDPSGAGVAAVPRADRHRREARGGGLGFERVLHRRPGRRRHAGCGRLRCGSARRDRRLLPADEQLPPASCEAPDSLAPKEDDMRRPDAYEFARGNWLLLAGLDPDSRVARPAKRRPGAAGRPGARFATRRAPSTRRRSRRGDFAAPGSEFQNAPLKVFGEHDPARSRRCRTAWAWATWSAGVVCADGHLGYAQPVGGVIAYEKQISISGVGFDIGCGNMAVRLDTPFDGIVDRVGPILEDVRQVISFGMGRANEERAEHALFDDADAWRESDMERLSPEGGGAARHGRLGQPLCRPDARRGRASSGSACISAAAASATPAPPATSRRPAARTA